jgi:hypothetical protein
MTSAGGITVTGRENLILTRRLDRHPPLAGHRWPDQRGLLNLGRTVVASQG